MLEPMSSKQLAALFALGPPLVSSDELIDNVVQVIADDLRLWSNSQNIVPDTPD
jgi:hypothetical protein